MDRWTHTDPDTDLERPHTGRYTDEMMVESQVPLDFLPLMYVPRFRFACVYACAYLPTRNPTSSEATVRMDLN